MMNKEQQMKERNKLVDILNTAIEDKAYIFSLKRSSDKTKRLADIAVKTSYENLERYDKEIEERITKC